MVDVKWAGGRTAWAAGGLCWHRASPTHRGGHLDGETRRQAELLRLYEGPGWAAADKEAGPEQL